MIRVVIDTNVFVSSFYGGNPREIVNLWKKGEVTLCLTRSIIDEYIDVLRRLSLQDEREFDELLNIFARGYHLVFTSKTPKLFVVESDPDDNQFIECAVALKADFVISGDKALVSIKDYMGIKVVTPKEFLSRSKTGLS